MNDLTTIFKLLSDETRLRILMLLYQDQLCVCQLSGILDVLQPRISKNLSKLRDLGLVVDERKEKFVFYSLKKENKILLEILENIACNLHLYSKLSMDCNKLFEKEKYLTQCNLCD